MKKRNPFAVNVFQLVLSFGMVFGPVLPYTFAQDEDGFKKAQWFFQHENYEEALSLLKDLRTRIPQSSEIACYLGMTYKRLQDFLAAKPHLEAAVTLRPNVKNAYLELIDLLYQCEDLDGAKQWIAEAEKESVNPAQLAFFKGLVFLKKGTDPQGAVDSFEEAAKLNPALAQSVKYQIGLAYIQLDKLKEAKSMFKEVVAKDPATDLAKFANEYMNAISRRQEASKPFHGSVGYSVQYDDNVIFRPNDDALATDVSKDDDWKQVFTARGDYNFRINKHFGIKTGFSWYGSKHNDLGYYDVMSYDLPVQPTFYFKNAAIAFPVHYNYVSVNDEKYLGTMGFGNVNSVMLGKRHMAQLQLQYNKKDFHWDVSDPADVKKSDEYLWAVGWFYFFTRDREGLLNLRYAMNYDDAKGANWRYRGNRVTFSAVVPLIEKLKWNLVWDYFRQDFFKKNTIYDKYRNDEVYSVINLLAYEIYENTEVQLQHAFVYDDANIGAYKFKKNTYSVGLKYRF
ncbi:MAG: tetratricopeptide repeat protein [Candidatus Omnitrophica bacterium]|nr:tetratricopeptide repeat protein [Candidatus Omnitrophota bacterium]